MEPTPLIETRTAIHSVNPDGIVISICKPGAEQTLEDARENIQAVISLSPEKGVRLFTDYTGLKSNTAECQEYYAGEEVARYFTACAILSDSMIGKVIDNFFMGINKPKTPTIIFTKREKAMDWLVTFSSMTESSPKYSTGA